MSLGAGAGALPLSAEIGRTVLSRQFFGGYSGIIGGFPPRPQSRANPEVLPQHRDLLPVAQDLLLERHRNLERFGGRAWNLTKNRGLTNCGSWCSARADRSIGRLAKGNAYKMRCAEKENAPRRNGVGSVRK